MNKEIETHFKSDKNVTKKFTLESFSFSNICYNKLKLASKTKIKYMFIYSGGKGKTACASGLDHCISAHLAWLEW